ncbi:zinc finger protein JAGGED-like [Pyrus ussuriensis x Pyrus communis]|uniref:Zinc finger protein JAGGED-like n=1 Tax=Pyrus ussuriensis x Pyrus communis TaxID=2448454 RepID=A0A5N5FQL2_9ROSA|nr:zinc finger protein JAGGED-like [Pyrus ussuriensis x Pyrus communis]
MIGGFHIVAGSYRNKKIGAKDGKDEREGGGGGSDGWLHVNQEETLNWSKSYAGTPSSINRFQHAF